MALTRNILTIQDISSCDFICTATGLRLKDSAYVSNQTGTSIPLPIAYTAPVDGGTDMIDGGLIIEFFDDATAYWTVDCTGAYTLTLTVPKSDCCAVHVDSTGNTVGLTPAAPVTAVTGDSIGDTLIEKSDDYISYWTWDGTTWVLDFQDSVAVNADINLTHENNVTDFTDGTVAAEQPVTAADAIGDTAILAHPNGTSYWTWDGTNWVVDFFVDNMDCCTTFDLQTGAAPAPATNATVGVPTTPTTGDTFVQQYDDTTVFYTYDGTNWVEDYRIPTVTTIGSLTNVNATADAPANDCDLLAWDATAGEYVSMDMTQTLNCAGLTA